MLHQTSRQAGSRRAKGVAGWGLPTISWSASRRQARAAASTYARLRAMGAVISASMPPASVLILRRCAQPQPTKVKGATLGVPCQARSGSVALISAAPAMGPVYLQSPTDAQISSGCSSVPIADIRRTFLTTAVDPSQSSSLGDDLCPQAVCNNATPQPVKTLWRGTGRPRRAPTSGAPFSLSSSRMQAGLG